MLLKYKESLDNDKSTIPAFRQRIVAHNKSIHTMVLTSTNLIATSALNAIHIWDPQVEKKICSIFRLGSCKNERDCNLWKQCQNFKHDCC